MEISEKIKELTEQRGASLQWLAQKIGMTKAGFYSTMANNSFKVDTLQKIADALEVPIIVFFGQDAATASNTEALEKENAMLWELNKSYKKIIEMYENKDDSVNAEDLYSASIYAQRCLETSMFNELDELKKEKILTFVRSNTKLWEKANGKIFNKYLFEKNEEKLMIELSKALLQFVEKNNVLK